MISELLPKINKRLDVSGRPVNSNCGKPIEKASKFLDYHLKVVKCIMICPE